MSKEKDYREVSQPKAEEIFSEPNDLAESLKDLEDYESFTNTDNVYQSTDGDRLVVEKHTPYEDAEKAKIKKASSDWEKRHQEAKDVYDEKDFNKDLLEDPKEIDELLELEPEFFKHLNVEENLG